MIVWLASYPRSGNTLLRIVLKQTMGLGSYSDELLKVGFSEAVSEEFGHLSRDEPWDSFYKKASASNELYLVKTHRPPRDNQPALYVVRDGRKVCLSYSCYHQRFTPPPYPSLLDLVVGTDFYGGWSEHFHSWMGRRNTVMVRYEDLVNASGTLLQEIAEQARYTGEILPWHNPFELLHQDNPDFFRKGEVAWQGDLSWTPLINGIFFHLHGPLMVKLGYANPEVVAEAKSGISEECLELVEVSRRLLSEKTQLESIFSERQAIIDGLKQAADDRLAVINTKIRIINEQARALQAYRLAYRSLYPLVHCMRRMARPARSGLEVLRPRLGNLNQYSPRPLVTAPLASAAQLLTTTPRFSIVTPSFQQGNYIERTIRSVLNQGYPELEYFIQDGGSQDGTVEVLRQYEGRFSGWVSEKDGGQSQAINRGFANTSGEIMAWLNSDDLLLPGALAIVADVFNRHPEIDVVYGNRLLIDENDMEIGRWIMPRHDSEVLSWVDYVPQETLFWRRCIWDKVGGRIDESFRFAMDWDLLVRFRDAGANFIRIPRFLGAFRIHKHQKTSAVINEIGLQEMDRIRERILSRVPSRREIRRAVLPYMLKHVAVDMLYRVKTRLGVCRV